MRIVGGRHRGRKIIGPEDSGDVLRPTSDRARESLFNVLEHGRFSPDGTSLVRGARVIDVFCGTGAFALEALSRGAAAATLIDKDPAAIALVHRNLTALGDAAKARVIQADATKPPRATDTHALAFLDPPYRSGLATPALTALDEACWLTPDALCIVEVERREPCPVPPGFSALDERSYGRARLVFLRKS
ncbi:MAG TPA: 16S rRNA (guanine(966)-N(2))-methyltransferase RsmD [Alphaproteobacteria bacterium]|nr:16S rRNA (guanine(966)-N(2))-methyltransferase RsmD [Alphaproteobacteria bacterium]